MVGAFDATLAKEFFIAFAANAGVTLHIRQLAGENTHHVIEGMFKAVARAMRQACEPDPAWATRCRPRRGCYKTGGACLTAVGPLDVAGGCGELLSPRSSFVRAHTAFTDFYWTCEM